MPTIAHISDLHFGAANEVAVSALADALSSCDLDLTVITGDLTQAGRRKEFAEAQEFLASISSPVFVIPGNHDVPVRNLWGRFTAPYARFQRFINEDTDPVFETDDLIIVGLNSARRAALDVNWSYGRLSRKQIEGASTALQSASTKALRAVATHHPYERGPGAAGARIVGRGKEAMSAFASHGVDMVFTGHVHHSKASIMRIGDKGVINIQAGTATSTRTRDEYPAYNLVTTGADNINVATYSLDGEKFKQTAQKTFAKQDSAGWTDV